MEITHFYDPNNGVYINSRPTRFAKDGKKLIPFKGATEVKLPKKKPKENELLIFSNNKWAIQQSFKGVLFTNTTTFEEVRNQSIGHPGSEWTDKKRNSEYEEWSGSDWVENLSKKTIGAKQIKMAMLRNKSLETMLDDGFDVIRSNYLAKKSLIEEATTIEEIDNIKI